MVSARAAPAKQIKLGVYQRGRKAFLSLSALSGSRGGLVTASATKGLVGGPRQRVSGGSHQTRSPPPLPSIRHRPGSARSLVGATGYTRTTRYKAGRNGLKQRRWSHRPSRPLRRVISRAGRSSSSFLRDRRTRPPRRASTAHLHCRAATRPRRGIVSVRSCM